MHKDFNHDFQTHLAETIASIEQQSQVELVVIIRNRAAEYPDIPLIWGLFVSCLTHTYLMLAPTLFNDLEIYLGPIVGFALGWCCAKHPTLQRLSLTPQRREKNVEIRARALFQKGGIHHTQAKIGVLIFCSLLEKSCFIVADRGAELALPPAEWQHLRSQLQSIFSATQPANALLKALTAFQPIFNRYLPPIANDLNELPDNLEIDL